jgi:hypothetical protein
MARVAKRKSQLKSPVVILPGGCNPTLEMQIQPYRQLLLKAFSSFSGTIISSGTTSGISKLVGEIAQKYFDAIWTIGYLPKRTPVNTSVDERYHEIRHTLGDFPSALESLQYWTDIITSAISLSDVKLLGINGGDVTAIEYRIALALGAYVAVIKDSGGEAAKLLQDNGWHMSKRLVQLPADAMTVRAFIKWESPELASDIREVIAQTIHGYYRHMQHANTHSHDPSMVPWDKLPQHLKESNRQHADHTLEKLSEIGCDVREVTSRNVRLTKFTEDEVEVMAEMEHGRWNVERLIDGWRWGERKDVMKKTSPYLVGWSELPDEAKEWDRELVRQIPRSLANVGLEVQRKP